MDNDTIRQFIREELEKNQLPCHFRISYDVNKVNSTLRAKLPVRFRELHGRGVNESLYCFDGGDLIKAGVMREIAESIKKEAVMDKNTAIYCILAEGSRLVLERITIES